ncbi:MAG: RND family transporter [Bacteroidales bacterium]|nr:RND family transporter [Bacteroidales bacterium]
MRSGAFIVKYRWLIIAISIVIPIVVGLQAFRAEIDPDMEKYIPPGMASRLSTQKIEEIFGGDELLIIVFESDDVLKPATLKRIKKIRRDIDKLEETDQVISLFDTKNMSGEEGYLLVESFIRSIPESEEEIEKLRLDLLENEMAVNVVVSDDFTLATIIISLKSEAIDEEIVASVRKIVDENPGDEKIFMGGLPYIKTIVAEELSADFKKLMIIGLLIMLVMLYLFFRELKGVLLPFAVVVLAIIFSMGFMPLIGWKLSIITLLLPIMLIAIANDYGIHLMARYQELNWSKENYSNGKLARKVYTSLRTPIMMTGITTIAGILCLLSHRMIPARQLGIVAAVGIFFALLLSLFFIPAILSMLKKSETRRFQRNGKQHLLEQILQRSGKYVTRYPRRILGISFMVLLITGLGMISLKVDTNLENFFRKNHPVKQSSVIINEVFGGSQTIAVHIEGDILDPAIMKQMDYYTEELKDYPGVGNVISVSTIIREISKAMNQPGDPFYDKIPDSKAAIAQYMELYNMSGNPEDLEKLVDFTYENAQIMIRINDGSNSTLNNVITKIEELTGNDHSVKHIGGYGLVVSEMARLVVRGQVISLIIAILIVMVLMTAMFRSLSAGIISVVPLSFALILLFGIMGYFGLNLDIATALLSSIMIGVGVDYTIHFLWRYRDEKMQGLSDSEAVIKTLTTTGRGIAFNALSVIIGFSVLPFSAFAPIRFFGYLVIISIFTCLVGALIIVPAMVILFKPRFLEKSRRNRLGIPLISPQVSSPQSTVSNT